MYSVLTAILWGLFYVCIEQIVKNIDKTTFITINYSASIVVFLFLSQKHIANDFLYIQNNPKIGIWILFAILSSIIGNYVSLLAVETSNATLAASLEITYPFWCMLFTVLLFGTYVSYISIIGILVVFSGVLIILYGER